MTRDANAEAKLLTEGVRSYVGAVNAVKTFRDVIQHRCRKVVVDRLAEYAKALDWGLTPDSVQNWETTASEWTGDHVTIGNYIRFGRASALYHYVYLTPDGTQSPELDAVVYLGSRKKLELFWNALHPHESALRNWDSSREVCLYESMSAEEFGRFDEKLDALLTRWIQLWKRAGGLKRLWKRAGDEEE